MSALRVLTDDDDAEGPGPRNARAADAFTDRTEYPLLVVTTSADGETGGCLAGFVTQCSIDPPRFLVCVSEANHTSTVVERASVLALHLLGTDQVDLASHFGEESGDRIDKFASVDWHPGPLGVPVLDDCAAWMTVGIIQRIDAGDHVALLTYPIDGGSGDHDGLLTNRTAPPLQPGHPVS